MGYSCDSPSEKEFRVGVFYANMKYIEETNAAQDSYRLGPNGFIDLTVEEFLKYHTRLLPMNIAMRKSLEWLAMATQLTGLPRALSRVSKNQGNCGSRWALKTTGSLEGAGFIKNGTLYSLS